MNSGVYCLKNIISGKVYIGSSINLRRRKQNHFTALRAGVHHNKHLQSSYNKYQKGFVFGIIEYAVPENIEACEQKWINYYQSNNTEKGYNVRLECSSNRGYKQSDHARKIISRCMSTRIISDETRKRMSESSKGRKLSEETKAKLRKENLPAERIHKMSLAKKGKPSLLRLFSHDDIRKIRESELSSHKQAEIFGVSKTTILNIRNRKIYSEF